MDDSPATREPWRRFDFWAAVLFLVLAAFAALLTWGLLLQGIPELFQAATVVASALGGAAIYLIAVRGLSAQRSWSRPVAVALLWLVIAVGLLELVTALSKGSLYVPLAAIAAALVLRARPAHWTPWPAGQGRPVAVAVASVIFFAGLPAGMDYLLRPGNSPLSVAADALQLTATLECLPPGAPADEVRAAASWRWSQHELLPHGEDAMVFRWRVSNLLATPPEPLYLPYLLDVKEAPGTGITPGFNPGRAGATGPFWLYDGAGPGLASAVAAGLVQAAEQRGGRGQEVLIEVDRQQLRDDTFLIVLAPDPAYFSDPASSGYEHNMVEFDVAYVHAGRWTSPWTSQQYASVEQYSCSW